MRLLQIRNLHQCLPRVDRLGEPGLDGLNGIWVATRKLLNDVPHADAVGAEAVQDGGAEEGEVRFMGVDVSMLPGFNSGLQSESAVALFSVF